MVVARRALVAVWVACAFGITHAGFSLYWAFGGRWLLDTVGQFAVDMARDEPVQSFWLLLLVGLVKILGAVVPVLALRGRIPLVPWWRVLSWIGSVFLILYGGLTALAAGASLLGWIDSDLADRDALVGHALLWDPLFFFWGLFLLLAMIFSRPERRVRNSDR